MHYDTFGNLPSEGMHYDTFGNREHFDSLAVCGLLWRSFSEQERSYVEKVRAEQAEAENKLAVERALAAK